MTRAAKVVDMSGRAIRTRRKTRARQTKLLALTEHFELDSDVAIKLMSRLVDLQDRYPAQVRVMRQIIGTLCEEN